MAAEKIFKRMSTRQLIKVFVETGDRNEPEIPTVRGWIMDELEARNPDAWDAFLGSDDCDDADLFKYYGC